jgi:hypothetical protein
MCKSAPSFLVSVLVVLCFYVATLSGAVFVVVESSRTERDDVDDVTSFSALDVFEIKVFFVVVVTVVSARRS